MNMHFSEKDKRANRGKLQGDYKGEIADHARKLGLQGDDIGTYRFMVLTAGLQAADDWAAKSAKRRTAD